MKLKTTSNADTYRAKDDRARVSSDFFYGYPWLDGHVGGLSKRINHKINGVYLNYTFNTHRPTDTY